MESIRCRCPILPAVPTVYGNRPTQILFFDLFATWHPKKWPGENERYTLRVPDFIRGANLLWKQTHAIFWISTYLWRNAEKLPVKKSKIDTERGRFCIGLSAVPRIKSHFNSSVTGETVFRLKRNRSWFQLVQPRGSNKREIAYFRLVLGDYLRCVSSIGVGYNRREIDHK